MLDGASRIGEVVAAAAADGQPALGITDHGNMYGVLDFYKEAKAQGINPIIGTEAYMAYDSRFERPSRRGRVDDSGGEVDGGRKLYYHLTLLAENHTGYKNLIQLSSKAFLEGYYYKPRLDWELLSQHAEGVIATTGCLGGHVLQALMNESFDAALEKAGRLQDIFGRDNLFVELQDHGIPEQHKTNPQLIEIAKRLRAPLLATNDGHYVTRADAEAHDALLCVQTGSLVADEKRFRFSGSDHYLKSAQEMRHLFREVEVACDNTLWIAERANLEIEFPEPELPQFPLPEGYTTDAEYLRALTYEGAHMRWGAILEPEVRERIEYELTTIETMGYSAYFIITWDLIKHARDKNIRVGPGRGSAAGCAVAYCLRITELDPIRYDLLFERFLNPARVSMPDIDMDFDSRYRDEMIRYAAERYGREHVAQIVTFSTIKARAAVRDSARVLGYPYSLGDKVAKAMPPLVMGRDTPLYACLEEHPKYLDGYKVATELREMYTNDPDAKKVMDVAKGIEGLRRQDGIHAAAVVITKGPLTDYLPIQRKPQSGGDPEDAPVVTQFEGNTCEDLGLLKMDFLGLRNLDVISDALELITHHRGVDVDIDNVTLDDPVTFAMLAKGETIGVFQLESPPMRALIRAVAPDCFEDVAALIALYRPGPMGANMHYDYADRKNGRKPIEFFHPEAEEVLTDTYGLMIYQESVMRVAQRFAGYSLAQADNLRKACGKKKPEMMIKERASFEEGVEATGFDRSLGKELFDIIERFADYAFNKSHSYGYGLVTYQTAYLKANYPEEYLSALLTSVSHTLEKAAIYLAECRAMGITVEVPDINRSAANFTPGDKSIIFGLAAVRNVGEGLVDLIVAEREARGPFGPREIDGRPIDAFDDFCLRVPYEVLNKRTIESIIKAGGFDTCGLPRKGLLLRMEERIDHIVARRREHDMGVMSLFGSGGDEPTIDEHPVTDVEFDKAERLSHEKEMLGLYVSDHPLMGYEQVLARRTDGPLSELVELSDGTSRTIGGVVTNLQRKWTKKGDLMAIFQLEDLQSQIEVMVFPRTMTEHGHKLNDDMLVVVNGRVDQRDDMPKFIAFELDVFDGAEESSDTPLNLKILPSRLDDALVEELRRVILEFPGRSEVHNDLGGSQVRLRPPFCVNHSASLISELRVLLGTSAVVL